MLSAVTVSAALAVRVAVVVDVCPMIVVGKPTGLPLRGDATGEPKP
jgi:hypothetical protein